MIILIIFLFVMFMIVLLGFGAGKRELVFFLSVIGVTLLTIATLFLFSSVYVQASPLYFILLLFAFIIIMLIISSRILK